MVDRIHRLPDGALALFWGCLAVVTCAAMIPLEPSLLEEGVILHFAQRMAQGEHLYHDLVFFSGPLPFELLALLFRIFGDEVAVARWTIVVLGGVACAAIFDDARRIGAGPLAHVAAAGFAFAPILLFPLLSTYFYTTLALSLAVLSASAALRGVDGARWAFAAGCLAALVALTKQNVGLVLGPGLLLMVLLQSQESLRRRHALSMIAGAVLVAVVTLGIYAARGDLDLLLEAMVVMPLRLGSSFGSPYMNLWPIGSFAAPAAAPFYIPLVLHMLPPKSGNLETWHIVLTQLLYALPFMALGALLLRRVFVGRVEPATWASGVVLVALLAQLFPRSDWGHLVFVLPPSVGLISLALMGRKSDVRSRWRLGASAAVVLGSAIVSLQLGIALHNASGDATFGDRVPLRASSAVYKGPDLRRVVDFLRARVEPGEPIFVARAEPLLYFATDTRNPTPYPGIIPGLGDVQDRMVVDALSKVRYVVMSERDSDQFFFYRDQLPETQRYLEQHFRVAKEFADVWTLMLVLERGPDRGAAALDLFDLSDRATAWVLDEAGRKRSVAPGQPKLVTSRNRRPLPLVLGPGGGGIDFELRIPRGAVFQVEFGLRYLRSVGAQALEHVPGSRFEISLRDDADFEIIGSAPLIFDEASATQWTPFEIGLDAYAEKEVTLRLQIVPMGRSSQGSLAWLGSPRLTSRSGDVEDSN